MSVLLDYLPIIAFVASFAMTEDLYFATAVLMVTMPIVLLGSWLLTKKINKIHLFSTVLVLVLGTVTLALRDSLFIAWKPTALNWALGLACIVSCFYGERPLIQRLMESALPGDVVLEAKQWRNLTLVWAAFFVAVGAVNLFVYYTYSESTWVYFKLWGLMGMTFAFLIAQGIWLAQALSKTAGTAEQDQQ
ncbi:MAG: inner membrane-spanning protein YciB [Pseudomonadota bacterium]